MLIGEGLAGRLGELLDARGIAGKRFVVTNALVWKLHGSDVAGGLGAGVIEIPDGERHKHLQTVQRVYDALVRGRAERESTVLAVGGGVVGDLAGFVAATYLRGLTFVQVPTTLLAQVDASIGGKVGVNLPAGKNLVGAFYPPRLVVIDPLVLRTLTRREFRAGLYEVIKYGMACSAPLFERLERELPAIAVQQGDALSAVIAECCAVKAVIVSEDEREAGPRRVLNFGHSVGHAVEALTGYRRFRHGEAVGWGMLAAGRLAMRRRLLAKRDFAALERLIMQLGPLPTVADLGIPQVIERMRSDKKVEASRLHFVVPVRIGTAAIVADFTDDEVAATLSEVGFQTE